MCFIAVEVVLIKRTAQLHATTVSMGNQRSCLGLSCTITWLTITKNLPYALVKKSRYEILNFPFVVLIYNRMKSTINRVPTAPRNSSNLLVFYFPPRISSIFFFKVHNYHDILFQVQLISRL